jgi:hypothetical protein
LPSAQVRDLNSKAQLAFALIILGFARCATAQEQRESPLSAAREDERIETRANIPQNPGDATKVATDGGSVTYIQYLLTATGESVPNAYPVSVPSYGDTSSPCTYSQSTLSLLPCYNPLKIQFDVVLPANFVLSTSSSSPSTLPVASLSGSVPSNPLMLTNSIDSTDGGVSSISATAYCTGLQTVVNITVTNEDSSVFRFTNGTNVTLPCSLSVTFGGSLSSSTTGDTGSFSLAPQVIISGTYLGNFTDSGTLFGTTGSSQMNMSVATNFTASGTVSIAASQVCAAQTSALTLSSSGTLAQANGVAPGITGISVGDSVELAASDTTTLIWFVASDENTLGVTIGSGTIFVTGYVVTGVCAGTYFWDAPFQLNTNPIRHQPPVAPHTRSVLVHPAWRLVFPN